MVIYINPVAKPRQTRADKWKQRPCVMRYRAFADELRLKYKRTKNQDAGSFSVSFFLPMPDSWSDKKKEEMLGKPHKQKPDFDNLNKAVFDALFKDDSFVWRVLTEKRWATKGAIIIQDF